MNFGLQCYSVYDVCVKKQAFADFSCPRVSRKSNNTSLTEVLPLESYYILSYLNRIVGNIQYVGKTVKVLEDFSSHISHKPSVSFSLASLM